MKTSIVFIVAVFIVTASLAQEKSPIFVGLQPGITKEKFYDDNEFDLNVIPIIFQMPVTKKIDIRATIIANYRTGGQSGFSDMGVEFVLPYHFSKEIKTEKSFGFYVGPVVNLGRNLLDDHNTYTLALEPGYMFKADERFTLALGLQVGSSYFDYDNEANKWVSHFGTKVNLGFWLDR